MYVYIESELGGLWTVGFYTPDGEWHPDSDHDLPEEAALRVHWLNGGNDDADIYRELLEVVRNALLAFDQMVVWADLDLRSAEAVWSLEALSAWLGDAIDAVENKDHRENDNADIYRGLLEVVRDALFAFGKMVISNDLDIDPQFSEAMKLLWGLGARLDTAIAAAEGDQRADDIRG